MPFSGSCTCLTRQSTPSLTCRHSGDASKCETIWPRPCRRSAPETPLRHLSEPLDRIAELLVGDQVAGELIGGIRHHIAARVDREARQGIDRLRIYISETYRLHRRMIRSRRSTAAKKGFPARGRELADPWLIPDPDERREDLFGAFDDLRLDLELTGDQRAGPILQVVLGRILAPVTALEDLVQALRGHAGP